ncbi:MAG: O-antigen ligase family protein [Deltaproteobacteria bacterium]|nr:O-antigen ligase family protein [Deltaproteobacteria bacterium]
MNQIALTLSKGVLRESWLEIIFSLFVCALLTSRTGMDVLLIVLGIFLALWLIVEKRKVPALPLQFVILALAAVWFVSIFWAGWMGYGDLSRLGLLTKQMRSLLVLGAAYCALVHFSSWEKLWRPALWVIGGISLFALYQHFTGIDLLRAPERDFIRAFEAGRYSAIGTFSHYITFAYVQSVAALFLWGGLLFSHLSLPKRLGLFSLFLIASFGVLFSYCRGAWIAFAAATFFLAFLRSRKIFAATLLVALLGVGIGLTLSPSLRSRAFQWTEVFDQNREERGDESVNHRLLVWKASIELFRQHPVLGIGYANYGARREHLRSHYPEHNLPDHPHNTYLQMLSDCGIIGFFVFVLFVSAPLILGVSHLRRNKEQVLERTLLAGALGGWLFFAIHSFVDEPLASSIKAKVTWFCLAVILAAIVRLSRQTGSNLASLPKKQSLF